MSVHAGAWVQVGPEESQTSPVADVHTWLLLCAWFSHLHGWSLGVLPSVWGHTEPMNSQIHFRVSEEERSPLESSVTVTPHCIFPFDESKSENTYPAEEDAECEKHPTGFGLEVSASAVWSAKLSAMAAALQLSTLSIVLKPDSSQLFWKFPSGWSSAYTYDCAWTCWAVDADHATAARAAAVTARGPPAVRRLAEEEDIDDDDNEGDGEKGVPLCCPGRCPFPPSRT